MKKSITRRDVLKGAGCAGLSAAAMSLFPPSIQRALAIPANNRTGTIKDVEHVVIFMQENRSFDNYFGTMKGVRGFGDRFTIPQPEGNSVWHQRDKHNQAVLPYHLDQHTGNAQRVKGTPHTWIDARDAWDKGRMTHWVKHKTPRAMSYYERTEIPFQFALAEAFTLCDAYYCSLHGGTTSNRLFFMTGTNGATANPPQIIVNNFWYFLEPGMKDGGFTYKTYPERLEDAGESWKIYQNLPHNFGCNVLVSFENYRKTNAASGQPVYNTDDPDYVAPPFDPQISRRLPLYKGVSNTMPDGGFLESFRQDIQAGRLPQVSWIIAPQEYSEHPSPSSPAQGSWYTQAILDALTANPEVWSKTVLLINFDENDGFFDHMPPPCPPSLADGHMYPQSENMHGATTLPPDALQNDYYNHPPIPEATSMPPPDGDVYGPGPRVPMYVVSPWSRGGWINSQNFDHTSVLRFLEARFGVAETNISPFRRSFMGDLTSAFNFREPNTDPLPVLKGRQTRESADQLRAAQEKLAQVPVSLNQQLPRQQAGYRPSRALPYQLHTTSEISNDSLKLQFANTGTQGCIFHVYDRLNLDAPPRRYGVEAGKMLTGEWQPNNSKYDLWVLSANGFHRHFTGDSALDPAAEIMVSYEEHSGNISLNLQNRSEQELTFVIKPLAYDDSKLSKNFLLGARQQQSIDLDLSGSGHWYDFEISLEGTEHWRRRVAGRVETGMHGITDPAMGT